MDTKITYDDILIVPNEAPTTSRDKLDARLLNGKLPVMVSPMDNLQQTPEIIAEMNNTGFEVVQHRFYPTLDDRLDFLDNLSDLMGTHDLYLAIGMREFFEDKDKYMEALKELSHYSSKFIIDVANGHNTLLYPLIREVWDSGYVAELIAGNIVTWSGARDLIENGATGVRCGIGTSRVCSSRINTGCGYPQFSALKEIDKKRFMRASVDEDKSGNIIRIPQFNLIADGGIRYVGDIAKALIYADKVMCGGLFARTEEVCKYSNNEYYGMASAKARRSRGEVTRNIEGVVSKVEPKYTIKELAEQVEDGLRSAMSYVGATNLNEFKERARWVRISPASYLEGLVDD